MGLGRPLFGRDIVAASDRKRNWVCQLVWMGLLLLADWRRLLCWNYRQSSLSWFVLLVCVYKEMSKSGGCGILVVMMVLLGGLGSDKGPEVSIHRTAECQMELPH